MNYKNQIKNYKPYNLQEKKEKEMILHYINNFDDVLTRNNKTCHFTTGNWIINEKRDKVLMVHHNIYNSRSWTGGHCDGDYDFLNVALNEAKEETGLKKLNLLFPDIFSLEILTVDAHMKRGEYVNPHLHLNVTYLWQASDKDFIKVKPDENSGVKWMSFEEVRNVVRNGPNDRILSIYEKINEKILKL